MSKYLSLIRGINVGGNSMVKMSDLKTSFESLGFTNVVTYINSGNVIFETNEKDINKITAKLENSLDLQIIILTQNELQKVIDNIPDNWKDENIRRYIAFLKPSLTTKELVKEITLKENIDSIKEGEKVVYMSTLLFGITQSGFSKLASKKVYKSITIRNFNTVQKLLSLMEK